MEVEPASRSLKAILPGPGLRTSNLTVPTLTLPNSDVQAWVGLDDSFFRHSLHVSEEYQSNVIKADFEFGNDFILPQDQIRLYPRGGRFRIEITSVEVAKTTFPYFRSLTTNVNQFYCVRICPGINPCNLTVWLFHPNFHGKVVRCKKRPVQSVRGWTISNPPNIYV